MNPTKKDLERALKMASRYLVFEIGELCDKCPADKGGEIRGCNGKNRLCQTEVKRHFIRKAQQANRRKK